MITFQRLIPRVPVADLKRTIDFYTHVLGFRVDILWPDDKPSFCTMDRERVSIGFFVPDGCRRGGTPGGSDLYIEVDDVKALHEILKDKLSIEWGPQVYWYGRREFAVCDPDGYLLIFTEETTDPPTCREE